jgi:hypothetical protein
MKRHPQKQAELGELVVAMFDEAANYSTDPREVSRLATWAVNDLLRGRSLRRSFVARPLEVRGRRLVN